MDSDSIKAFVLLAGGQVKYDMSKLVYEVWFLHHDTARDGNHEKQWISFTVPDDIDEEGLVVQLMLARAATGKTGLHDPRR